MKGWLNATPVANGRAVSVSGEITWPLGRPWLARLSAGSRSCVTGGDTEKVVLGDLWLPAPLAANAITVEIELGRWRGRAALTAPAKDVPFELAKGVVEAVFPKGGPDREPAHSTLEPPFAVPPVDPRKHPGFVIGVAQHGHDRLAVFRTHGAGEWTVTLAEAAQPERAIHMPCFGGYGGFDPAGKRFWFARTPTSVAIVDLANGTVEGQLALHGMAGSIHLDGDWLYTYRDCNYTEPEGFVMAASWTGAPARIARHAPRWLRLPAFHPRATRMAWIDRLGGGRRKLAWLDLETYEGGESWLADSHERVSVAADGTITTSE